jgi:hypothetical protein
MGKIGDSTREFAKAAKEGAAGKSPGFEGGVITSGAAHLWKARVNAGLKLSNYGEIKLSIYR